MTGGIPDNLVSLDRTNEELLENYKQLLTQQGYEIVEFEAPDGAVREKIEAVSRFLEGRRVYSYKAFWGVEAYFLGGPTYRLVIKVANTAYIIRPEVSESESDA